MRLWKSWKLFCRRGTPVSSLSQQGTWVRGSINGSGWNHCIGRGKKVGKVLIERHWRSALVCKRATILREMIRKAGSRRYGSEHSGSIGLELTIISLIWEATRFWQLRSSLHYARLSKLLCPLKLSSRLRQ